MRKDHLLTGDSYHSNRTSRDVVYVGLVLSSVVISVLSISLSVYNQMLLTETEVRYTPVCYTCDKLTVTPPDFINTELQGLTRHGDKCCAENQQQLQHILSMVSFYLYLNYYYCSG